MILSMILAVALTEAQQQKHDAVELALYARMQADENKVAEIWRPSPKLLSDYRAARRCYVQFHLYKVESCTEEFDRVDQDLSPGKGVIAIVPDLGRVAYEAYCRRSGYRSVISGKRFADYHDLPRESKDAWAAAANAVADKLEVSHGPK